MQGTNFTGIFDGMCHTSIKNFFLLLYIFDIHKVFPDNFHLNTLNEFLEACAELHPDVKIKNVLGTLIEHLALYAVAEDSPGIPGNVQLFEIFSEHADKMIGSRSQMPAEEIISIQVYLFFIALLNFPYFLTCKIALLNLAFNCYRNRPEFADSVFSSTAKVLANLKITP
jgi:vacuolar protein sorting-associated protein 35